MQWIKQGLIFCPDKNYDWMSSHAANPVVEYLGNDYFRVYFSCRNNDNQASIGYLEFDLKRFNTITYLSEKPVLSPGMTGCFDDSGVSMGYLVKHHGQRYLYYLGWNLGVTVPWRNSIGLAIAEGDSMEFERYSLAPLLDRCHVDPYSISYPCVFKEENIWRMWYGSNLKWGRQQEEMAHLLKYAESQDGISWQRKGTIALDFKNPGEYAMSKPSVIKKNDGYKMWYSYRGKNYRIGYAESLNGKDWVRKDTEVGIDVSPQGWDSEAISYPHVFEHENRLYMLYNGNSYGKTGFGLAILESELY